MDQNKIFCLQNLLVIYFQTCLKEHRYFWYSPLSTNASLEVHCVLFARVPRIDRCLNKWLQKKDCGRTNFKNFTILFKHSWLSNKVLKESVHKYVEHKRGELVLISTNRISKISVVQIASHTKRISSFHWFYQEGVFRIVLRSNTNFIKCSN